MYFNSVFKCWINNDCLCFRVSQFYFINTVLHDDSSKIELKLSIILNDLSIRNMTLTCAICYSFCLCLKNKHYLWLLFNYLNMSLVGFFFIYFNLLRCVGNYRLKIIQTNLTTSLHHSMAVIDATTSKGHHPMMTDINLYTLYCKPLLINEFREILFN